MSRLLLPMTTQEIKEELINYIDEYDTDINPKFAQFAARRGRLKTCQLPQGQNERRIT